jgi:hypothetical protein
MISLYVVIFMWVIAIASVVWLILEIRACKRFWNECQVVADAALIGEVD